LARSWQRCPAKQHPFVTHEFRASSAGKMPFRENSLVLRRLVKTTTDSLLKTSSRSIRHELLNEYFLQPLRLQLQDLNALEKQHVRVELPGALDVEDEVVLHSA